LLHAVSHDNASLFARSWIGIGIQTEPGEDNARRFSKLIESLEASVPAEDAKYAQWFRFARSWAELIVLLNDHDAGLNDALVGRAMDLQSQVDTGFSSWLAKRYGGLINLPPVPPVMVHHVPRLLARQVSDDPNTKIALIVVDGMAMDQWLVIRKALASNRPDFQFGDNAVFAWIPSLTSVSRQATFAGRAPIFFPRSIGTTDREPSLWAQFWSDSGLTPNQIVYMKGLGDGGLEAVSEALSHPRARIVGLVVDKVDRIMHGMEMGTAGMHNQVEQWARQPHLTEILDLLLEHKFRVYLTSDHGNIEATGCGRPAEGAVADVRGERVRVYPDVTLRSMVKEKFPAAVEWDPIGLPEDYLPLLAPSRKAFVQNTKRIVSHGGASIEELIVPLVEITRRVG